MAHQQLLSSLIGLAQKLLPHRAEIVVGFAREGIAKVLPERHPAIDQIGTEMVEQLNPDAPNPGNIRHRIPHIAGHQEGEVWGAPIGRQSELDPNVTLGLDFHQSDEFQGGHGLIKLRIGHGIKCRPNLLGLIAAGHRVLGL